MILHTLKPTSNALTFFFYGSKLKMAGRRKKGKMISELFFLLTLIMQCHEVFKMSFHNLFLADIKGDHGCPTPEVLCLSGKYE